MKHPITIFTATYNRAYTLPNLYVSLCKQTFQDFNWFIVDDGSIDGTDTLVSKWTREEILDIKYLYQKNAGKMAAINNAVTQCDSELFFIVDSDDCLPHDSIEKVVECWQTMKTPTTAGVIGLKGSFKSSLPLGTWFPTLKYETNYRLYHLHNFIGDAAQVYRVDVLQKHLFPIHKGEKFVPEGYIWCEIDKSYNLAILNDIIYECQYLSDGYTQNIIQNLIENPFGFRLYYAQQVHLAQNLPFLKRLIEQIKYTRAYLTASFIIGDIVPALRSAPKKVMSLLILPFAYLQYKKTYTTPIKKTSEGK